MDGNRNNCAKARDAGAERSGICGFAKRDSQLHGETSLAVRGKESDRAIPGRFSGGQFVTGGPY